MPAAAALLNTILAEGYAPGMLRAAKSVVAELDSSRPEVQVKVVAPRRFVMPRAEKPKDYYVDILEWEEGEVQVASVRSSGYERRRYEYLHHGGAYVERVLAMGRKLSLSLRLAGVGCSSDDVPQWPPRLEPVPDVPKQVYSKTSRDLEQEQEPEFSQIPRWTPSPSGEVPVGFFIGSDGSEWPLPPREYMDSPIEGFLRVVRPGLQWSKTSMLPAPSPNTEKTADAHVEREPSPGYFIGRDGNEWPLPPRECMSSAVIQDLLDVGYPAPNHVAAPEPAPVSQMSRDYAPSRGPKARPGYFIGRGGLEWPLPPLEFVDPAVLEAHRDSPAPTPSVAAGTSPSADTEASDFPSSISTTSSTDSMLPITPECGPLELTDWRGLQIATIGDSGPATTRAELMAPMSPCVHVRTLEDAYVAMGCSGSPVVKDGYFRGRDGTWWPLPPTEEELDEESDGEEEKERRGRSPTPKWSMLRA